MPIKEIMRRARIYGWLIRHVPQAAIVLNGEPDSPLADVERDAALWRGTAVRCCECEGLVPLAEAVFDRGYPLHRACKFGP